MRDGQRAALRTSIVLGIVAVLTLTGTPAWAEDLPSVPAPTVAPSVPAPTVAPSVPAVPLTDPPADPPADPVVTPDAESPAASPAQPAKPPERTRLPLRFDDRGPLVAQAQDRLVWLGYELSENSRAKQLFGITMRRAVKAFQAKNWLEPTGVVDGRTWRTLEKIAGRVGQLPRRCTEVATAVCIDKTARVLRFVVDGRVRMTADARFGGPGMETGEGTFRVNSKSYNHVSSAYGSWMPRAMFFNGDEAVHYSPDFAQVGYSRGSHGCVGLRDMEKATWLYNRVPVGTRVVVYWS